MPTLPRKPRARKWNKRERRPTGKQQEIYNKSKWTRFSAAYRTKNPICEVCQAAGNPTDITPGGRKGVTDHVIRADKGGAWYDEKNLMPMCKAHHDRKTSMEGKGMFDWLVGEINEYGYLVPTAGERKKVIDMLIGEGSFDE